MTRATQKSAGWKITFVKLRVIRLDLMRGRTWKCNLVLDTYFWNKNCWTLDTVAVGVLNNNLVQAPLSSRLAQELKIT